MHPCWRMYSVAPKLTAVIGRKEPAKSGRIVRRDTVFTKVTKCLNNKPRGATGGGHISRGRAAKLNFLISDNDGFADAVGKIDNFGGDLLGEAQPVYGVGTGWLQTSFIFFADRFGDCVWGWTEQSKFLIYDWIIIKTACESSDGPGLGVT